MGTEVSIFVNEGSTNPLGPPVLSPPILLTYSFNFDFMTGFVTYRSRHSAYPWHEMDMRVGGSRVLAQQDSPRPGADPLSLYWFDIVADSRLSHINRVYIPEMRVDPNNIPNRYIDLYYIYDVTDCIP